MSASPVVAPATNRVPARAPRRAARGAALASLMVAAATVGLAGCDPSPKGEGKDLVRLPSSTSPATGPAVTIERRSLRFVPFSAELPSDWTVESDTAPGGISTNLVRGKTPRGEVEIILLQKTRMKADEVRRLVEAAENPNGSAKPAAGTSGPSTGPATAAAVPAARTLRSEARVLRIEGVQGVEYIDPVPPYTTIRVALWTAVDGVDVDAYEIAISNLTDTQFREDRELFRRMVDSLKHEPGLVP